MSVPWSAFRSVVWFACLIVFLAGGFSSGICRAGEASLREPPPIFKEKLESLLTPAEEVLSAKAAPFADEGDAEEVLDEEVHYIEPDGKRYFIRHRIFRAITQSGVADCAEQIFSYRKSSQRIYLISADTILANGSRIPIGAQAAILQTPQRQADDAIYSDEGELRLIYSNVKPGTSVEAIVLVEEKTFRIPGEFTAFQSWLGYWPARRRRMVLEMPATMAERLKICTLGRGVPTSKKSEPHERVRWIWERNGIANGKYEPARAPSRQVGPSLWLTTLPDWETFGSWWSNLVDQRSRLKPEIAAKVEEWTKDISDKDEILAILFEKVANDVRYVGLEFGDEDLQPHDCNEVWEKQYGDCKDKSNLLRVMLKQKGIESWMVLLNTNHTGIIEKRSPDYRQFDHAILAVEADKLTFCDPTIRYGKPGVLGSGALDREVLLVKDGQIKWARTPAESAGKTEYRFELKVSPNGELTGWLTGKGTGYRFSSYKAYLEDLDKNGLTFAARGWLRSFYKEAELVDVSKVHDEKGEAAYGMKAYFIVNAPEVHAEEGVPLFFPSEDSMIYDLGPSEDRETAYPISREKVQVEAIFELPPGYQPASLPRPLRLRSDAIDASGEWSKRENRWIARLDLITKKTQIAPKDFQAFCNARSAIRTWLDKPLNLVRKEGAPKEVADNSDSLEDFPMMASGDGQLELVEKRFPSNGDTGLRLKALEQTIQYFVHDPTTVFRARVKIALLDWDEGRNARAAEELKKLIQSYDKRISADDIAWAEYIMALAYRDDGKPDIALPILDKIINREDISEERRGWACLQSAYLLEETDPHAAFSAVERGLSFESSAHRFHFAFLAIDLFQRKEAAEFEDRLLKFVDSKSDQVAPVLEHLIGLAPTLLPEGGAEDRQRLLEILSSATEAAGLSSELSSTLAKASQGINSATIGLKIKKELLAYIEKNPLPALPSGAEGMKSEKEFKEALDKAQEAGQARNSFRYAVEILLRFDPDGQFGEDFWTAVNCADWKERYEGTNEPILPVLIDLADLFPRDSEVYLDTSLLRATRLARKKDTAGACKALEEILEIPNIPSVFRASALVQLGENHEARKDYEKALAKYEECEQWIQYSNVKTALLRAIFLNLERDNKEEAFRIIELLAKRPRKSLDGVVGEVQIVELITLAGEKPKASEYWEGAIQWREDWESLMKKWGAPASDAVVTPVVEDLAALGLEIGEALRKKDAVGYLERVNLIASGARWLPSYANEFASLLTYSPLQTTNPRLRNEMLVKISDNFRWQNGDVSQRNLLFGMIGAVNLEDHAKAAEIARKFAALNPSNTPVSYRMARLWAITAKYQASEVEAAMAALEKALAAEDDDARGMSVTLLADLYALQGRKEDEKALLERELANPSIKENPNDLKRVEERQQQVSAKVDNTKRFNRGLEKWLNTWKPKWYDYAKPYDLADGRLTDLEKVLKNPRNFLAPEIIKLNLLVAADEEQPLERRQDALLEAAKNLSMLAPSCKEAILVLRSIVWNADFDEDLRVDALWRGICEAAYALDSHELEKLAADPLVEELSDSTTEMLKFYRQMLSTDDNSAEAVAKLSDSLLALKLDGTRRLELKRLHRRLLELGREDLAEEVRKRLANVLIDPNSQLNKSAVQVEFISTAKSAGKWLPARNELRKLIVNAYPAGAGTAERMGGPRPVNLDLLEDEEARNVRISQVWNYRGEPLDYAMWMSFGRDSERDKGKTALTLNLIRALLKLAPGDVERARSIMTSAGMVDMDDPALREEVSRIWSEFRHPVKHPLTYASIRAKEIALALRRGLPVNVDRDLDPLQYPSPTSALVESLRLRHWIQQENKESLARYVEADNLDFLFSEPMVADALRIFQLLRLEESLEITQELARNTIYKKVLGSWANLDAADAVRACELAHALGETSLLPQAWFDTLLEKIRSRGDLYRLKMWRDLLAQDWPALLADAEEACDEMPAYYHSYWLKAVALCYLGRPQEAVKSLETYTSYSKDEYDYPMAVKWLAEIRASAPSR